MKLSLAPSLVSMTTAASMAAAVEDAPLLQKDILTDSTTTTKKKGYSSGVRLSVAFGTFAFLLLGVVLFADRYGKINTNIIDNTLRSGKEKLHTTGKKGICETTGTYNDVLPFLDHQKVIPGQIYYGLDFDEHRSYVTWLEPGCSLARVGISGDNVCPSPQRQIVHAWQQCAKLCNDEPDCSTFSVHTDSNTESNPYNLCYFHKSYTCQKNDNKQSVGIDKYVHRGKDIRDATYDDLGVWSGICRTISGRTNDYACSNTPIPKKDFSPIPKKELKCFGHTNYDGCLNGFYGPNEVRQFSGPDGIWVFDVGNIMGRPCPACDNVPDCDHFCDECAGGPVKAGACSADNQYFCLPGP